MLNNLLHLLLKKIKNIITINNIFSKIKCLTEDELVKLDSFLVYAHSLNWQGKLFDNVNTTSNSNVSVDVDSDGLQDLNDLDNQNTTSTVLKHQNDNNSKYLKPGTEIHSIPAPLDLNKSKRVRDVQDKDLYNFLRNLGLEDEDLVLIEEVLENENNIGQLAGFDSEFKPSESSLEEAYYNDSLTQIVKTDFPKNIDSVYNYAVFYIYGSRDNNSVTCFSIDAEKRLFVNEQQKFKIKNASDVIEVCDQIDMKYELDAIFFVDTDNINKIFSYVEKGVQNQYLCIRKTKEMVSFKNRANDLIPLVSTGEVLLSNDPWLQKLKGEINNFFMGNNAGYNKSYSYLRSFIYGVDIWDKNIDTDLLSRDYGNQQKDI